MDGRRGQRYRYAAACTTAAAARRCLGLRTRRRRLGPLHCLLFSLSLVNVGDPLIPDPGLAVRESPASDPPALSLAVQRRPDPKLFRAL